MTSPGGPQIAEASQRASPKGERRESPQLEARSSIVSSVVERDDMEEAVAGNEPRALPRKCYAHLRRRSDRRDSPRVVNMMRAKSKRNSDQRTFLDLCGSERSALVAHARLSNQTAIGSVGSQVVFAVGRIG